MSAYTDMVAARDAIAAAIKTEAEYVQTNGPKPQYSVEGQSFDWPGWLRTMIEQIEKLNALLAKMQAPSIGITQYRP